MSTETSVVELSDEEARKVFDRAAHRWMHMTGPDFLAKWDDGAFQDCDDLPVQQVAMLLPLGRA